ncbi:hypothetical protein RRG08_015569 [Elysia crispata]|uniref:Uncharacterized protein n=1 Tax=Elysia crispata TaxID=231223 RepID=A0AAE0YJZ9_9GAST|nr:hypothetical protein RRG08_015569 [Elysia crispata]
MTKKMTGVQLHNSLLYEPVFPIAEAALPLKSIWYNQNVLSRVDLFPEGEQTGFGGNSQEVIALYSHSESDRRRWHEHSTRCRGRENVFLRWVGPSELHQLDLKYFRRVIFHVSFPSLREEFSDFFIALFP